MYSPCFVSLGLRVNRSHEYSRVRVFAVTGREGCLSEEVTLEKTDEDDSMDGHNKSLPPHASFHSYSTYADAHLTPNLIYFLLLGLD